MAKRVRRAKPPPKPPEPLSMFWTAVAGLALVASLGLYVSIAFSNWRETDAVTYHYTNTWDAYNIQHYYPTQFGLFLISFNGGSEREPWYVKAERMCAGIFSYAPQGALLNLFVSAPCPESCVAHYRTRCEVYQRLTTIGYIALGTLIISGLLGLVGVGWTFMFGLSPTLLQVFWMGGGTANIVAILYWLYETDAGFKQLALQSQYPYPDIGIACYGGLSCSGMLILLGLATAFSSFFESPKDDPNQAQGANADVFQPAFGFNATAFRPPAPRGPGGAFNAPPPGAGGGPPMPPAPIGWTPGPCGPPGAGFPGGPPGARGPRPFPMMGPGGRAPMGMDGLMIRSPPQFSPGSPRSPRR